MRSPISKTLSSIKSRSRSRCLKRKGSTLLVLDAHDDATAQASQVEDLIRQHVQALIVIPVGATPDSTSVKAAKSAGIPVVTVDRNPTDTPGDTFVGTDNVTAAKILGEYACKVTVGKAELEIIESPLHTRHEDERNKGFTAAMESCPGINEDDRDWTHRSEADEGFRYAEKALESNPAISLIFGRVDSLALGAARAVKAGRLDHKVYVIGFDGDPEALQAVKDGTLAATMTQRTSLIGRLALQSALDLIGGGQVPSEQVQDAVLTTSGNVDQILAYHP